MFQVSYLTVSLFCTCVYFMWMDVALYINLQQTSPLPPSRDNATAALTPASKAFSPFAPISVKLLFQGPTIHYIDESLAYWTVACTGIVKSFSADAVSFMGLGVAAIGARLLASPTPRSRYLGVALFKVRDYADSLDGWVARWRRNQEEHQQSSAVMKLQPGTWGYYLDGICDGVAYIMLYLALAFLFYQTGALLKVGNNGYNVLKIPADSEAGVAAKEKQTRCSSCWRKASAPVGLLFRYGMQTFLASVAWNYSLLEYQDALESTAGLTEAQLRAQNAALKSSTMWMVTYLWRLFNPHTVVQFLLVALLYNRAFEYIFAVQYLGYIPIAFTAVLSHIYARIIVHNIENA